MIVSKKNQNDNFSIDFQGQMRCCFSPPRCLCQMINCSLQKNIIFFGLNMFYGEQGSVTYIIVDFTILQCYDHTY